MLRMIGISESALLSQSRALALTGNNLANSQTPGYKAQTAEFSALMAQQVAPAVNAPPPSRVSEGSGASVRAGVNGAEGPFQPTGQRLDVAVIGSGFFAVQTPAGTAYTRSGIFQLDAQGNLVTPAGYRVLDVQGKPIRFPPSAGSPAIAADGQVTTRVGGATQQIAQIGLASFANPAGLTALGGGLWQVGPNSGTPATGAPGTGTLGTLQSGGLEGSNVSMVQSMTDLVKEQAAFGANAQMLSIGDRVWKIANGL